MLFPLSLFPHSYSLDCRFSVLCEGKQKVPGRGIDQFVPLLVSACPQVLVLELETRLQKERERLGELRKKHYELAGVAEGWGEEEEGKDREQSQSNNRYLSPK